MDEFGASFASLEDSYDPVTCVIHRESSTLKPYIAPIKAHLLQNPHIKYFQQLNPEWHKVSSHPHFLHTADHIPHPPTHSRPHPPPLYTQPTTHPPTHSCALTWSFVLASGSLLGYHGTGHMAQPASLCLEDFQAVGTAKGANRGP